VKTVETARVETGRVETTRWVETNETLGTIERVGRVEGMETSES